MTYVRLSGDRRALAEARERGAARMTDMRIDEVSAVDRPATGVGMYLLQQQIALTKAHTPPTPEDEVTVPETAVAKAADPDPWADCSSPLVAALRKASHG